MARYGQAFKDRAVARLLPPESATVQTLARELSISAATLTRWRAEALSQPVGERGWSAGARFEAVLSTAAMDEASKGAWCREHGVYPQTLEQWRTAALQALDEPEEVARQALREKKAEHVFAAIEAMGGKMIRTIGQARADFALTLMAACYNIRRTVWLVKSNAIPW